MEKLNNLLNDFSSKYPQLKNIQIEIIPYNNLYIAICLVIIFQLRKDVF